MAMSSLAGMTVRTAGANHREAEVARSYPDGREPAAHGSSPLSRREEDETQGVIPTRSKPGILIIGEDAEIRESARTLGFWTVTVSQPEEAVTRVRDTVPSPDRYQPARAGG